MEHGGQVLRHRRKCPVCKSQELIRLTRTWKERLIGWFVGAHKYRCFICGHEFMGKVHNEPDRNVKVS